MLSFCLPAVVSDSRVFSCLARPLDFIPAWPGTRRSRARRRDRATPWIHGRRRGCATLLLLLCRWLHDIRCVFRQHFKQLLHIRGLAVRLVELDGFPVKEFSE